MDCEQCGNWSGDRKFCTYNCASIFHRKQYKERLKMIRTVFEERQKARETLISDGYYPIELQNSQ